LLQLLLLLLWILRQHCRHQHLLLLLHLLVQG
jgi:hypothetical protein